MNIQTQVYLEQMQEMYNTIIKNETLSEMDILFLNLYNRTIV